MPTKQEDTEKPVTIPPPAPIYATISWPLGHFLALMGVDHKEETEMKPEPAKPISNVYGHFQTM